MHAVSVAQSFNKIFVCNEISKLLIIKTYSLVTSYCRNQEILCISIWFYFLVIFLFNCVNIMCNSP